MRKYKIINPASKKKLISELEKIGVVLRFNGRAIAIDSADVELFEDRLQTGFKDFSGGFNMKYKQCYIKTNQKDAVWLTAIGKSSVFVGFYTHLKEGSSNG